MLASQQLLLGTFYRPPTDNQFFDKFHAILEDLWLKRSNIMIITRNVGLENVIKEPTRTTEF